MVRSPFQTELFCFFSSTDKGLRLVSSYSAASHVKLGSLTDEGMLQMKSLLEKSLREKPWEKVPTPISVTNNNIVDILY